MITLDKSIAWEKIAEPQPDFYDVDILLQVSNELYGYVPVEPTAGSMTMLDGRVEVKFEPPIFQETLERITREEVEERNIIKNLDTTLSYTRYYETVAKFLDAFHPIKWTEDNRNYPSVGCACGPMGSPERGYIEVSSTCYNPISGVDGLIHEVWHQRMHALGVDFEDHKGLLFDNSPDELYDSPIRKDKLRPMSAVVQAQCSYIGVTDFYRIMIDKIVDKNIPYVDVMYDYLGHNVTARDLLTTSARNVFRIREGYETIETHIRPTPDVGERFFYGFQNYTKNVVDQAIEQLKHYEQQLGMEFDWGPRV